MSVYTFSLFYLQGVWLWEFGAAIWNPRENRSYDGRNGCKPEGTDRVKAWGQVTGGRERVGSGSVEWSGSVVVGGRLGAGRREAGGVAGGGWRGGRRVARREAARREAGGTAGGGWHGGRRVARTGRRRGSTGREVVFRGQD
ncbi:hypothetical protein C8J57DRAFT_1237760 [Mycena rebaudengoi]|nr:hypothetical protein C8J57DRAFT_1237760 [Mycena rebaudengoi]